MSQLWYHARCSAVCGPQPLLSNNRLHSPDSEPLNEFPGYCSASIPHTPSAELWTFPFLHPLTLPFPPPRFGSLDVAVLCAGIGERGDIFDPSIPRLKQPGGRAPGWQLTLDVDLTAVMTGTRCGLDVR